MRRHFAAALAIALVLLGLVAEYFASGTAAVVQSLFYLALLALVIVVLRLVLPRSSSRK